MDFTMEDFEKNLDSLRENEAAVPRSELYGKYRLAYSKLVNRIADQTEEILGQYIFGSLLFKIGEDAQKRDEFFRKAQAVIDADTGLKDRIHTAVREHYSSSELLMVAADLYEKVRDRAYMPYWSSHCSTGPDGRIWNDIIEMYWNPGHRSWENMEQGRFMAAWPPAV